MLLTKHDHYQLIADAESQTVITHGQVLMKSSRLFKIQHAVEICAERPLQI
jgi:hypothetical protein